MGKNPVLFCIGGTGLKKALHFCAHVGCRNLTSNKYCDEHAQDAIDEQKRWADGHAKGSSRQRGYDSRWEKYRKWYLSKPEHMFCALHLAGCTEIATCIDHIVPPQNRDDPLFWDTSNHQPSCIHCNSVKGHTTLRGTWNLGGNNDGEETDTDSTG